MPEFQRRKRRSLTDQQLYEEYNRIDEPKAKEKAKSAVAGKKAKKAAKKPPAREAPPVSPQRQERQRKQQPVRKKKKAAAKKQQPSSKPQPRKKRRNMTLYYVLVGIVVIATVSILSVTVLFNISSFAVEGSTAYSDDEIIAASGIEKGDNLLRLNIAQAQERIVSNLVYIDSAVISRGFPNRLVIAVEPARPALSFAVGGSYYVISERGRLLEIGQISADCPVVTGFSPISETSIGSLLEDDEEDRIEIALRMIGYMKQYGLNEYCDINLSDTLNIRVSYDNRIEMELGASTQLEDKFYYASILIRDEITAAERCTLILSNPERVVKRPIYDNDTDDGYIVEEDPEDNEDNEEPEEPEGE